MSPSDAPKQPAERRVTRRKRAFLAGKVVYDDGAHSFECTIKDISDSGARVEFSAGRIAPKGVVLIEMRGGIAYLGEVRWRSPSAMGIFFLRSFSLTGPIPAGMDYVKQHWDNQANANIPEMTPEMIREGVAAYRACKLDESSSATTDEDMIRMVLAAVLRTMRK
jgi:hypothetical protein